MSTYKRFWITYSLILICVVVYAFGLFAYGIQLSAYDAYRLGAFSPALVNMTHQFWRFITANFVHFGLLHITLNCIALKNISCFLEQVFTKKQYLFIIIVSGICTNLLGYVIYLFFGTGGFTISGGISGIIFGMMGSIVVLGRRSNGMYHHIYHSLLPNIIFMFILSVCFKSISFNGHLGGFIGGILATIMIRSRNKLI